MKYPINIVLAYIPKSGKILLNKRIDEPYEGLRTMGAYWRTLGGGGNVRGMY